LVREGLLSELGLPGEAKVRELSGGQRQRVAIARALAFAPTILAWDEPTSGLDPAMRDRVAERILLTSREHGTTTLVVTHDLAGLLPIADRVLLIDPQRAALVEVASADAEEKLARLTVPTPTPAKAPGIVKRAGRTVLKFLETSGRVMEGMGQAALALLPRWPNVRWGLRFLRHYLMTVAGPGALLYFLMAGAVIGLVSAYFTFTFLPKRGFTEPLILDDLIGGLGFGLHRILVPLIMTLLLAARAGAAVSADISTRVAGKQTDAMRSIGVPPARYLFTGTLWAFLIGTPILAVLSYFGARVASAAVFAVMAPDLSIHAFDAMYSRLLIQPGEFLPAGTAWVAAKDLTAAFGIATIAYFAGASPKDSPEEVAGSITQTVIWATFLVLSVHLVFALIEF
jgi:ABC-type transporter Mla maintaining outer membrane lipid asymmetry permease subunit MlaE